MPAPTPRARSVPPPREFVGVRTHCCGQYARAYREPGGRYAGHCPRCGRAVRVAATRVPRPA